MKKKSIPTALLSFAVLCVGYFVIRYALFDIHGMKEWPLDLLIGCIVVLVVSCIAGSRILPPVTSVSYIIGFVIGLLFHKAAVDNAVGSTDNLWIIWTATVIAAVIVSGTAEFVKTRKTVR